MTVTPVNYRKQDASPEAIARDVEYALQIADFYLGKLPEGRRHLTNLRVLELGPGYSLGTAVVLASHGAHVSVADRYLSPFDADYHDPFLRALLRRLQAERPELYTAPLVRLLEAGTFLPDVVEGLHLGIEDLAEVPDDSFDLVVSNAVFEHVEDVPRAFGVLARITQPGGLGVHQVDFRDHRDFSRPLEYLTMPAAEFAALFRDVHGECGNRWRPAAMHRVIEQAGFAVAEFDANMLADDAYLDDLRPRLHADYAAMDREALRAISGCFVLRNAPAPAAAAMPGSVPSVESPARLARARARYATATALAAGARVLELGCGTGLGVRELLSAGATVVLGLDRDPNALDVARAADPRGESAWDGYVLHDLRQALPYADGSFDLVVAFELLDQLDDPASMCAEVLRVLSPDGVALLSVPNPAFEEYWSARGAAPHPRTATLPDLDRLVELLADFEWVEFHGQVDVAASLVLPLDGREQEPGAAALCAPAGTTLDGSSTHTIVARCFRTRPASVGPAVPVAYAFGDPTPGQADPSATEKALQEKLRRVARGRHN